MGMHSNRLRPLSQVNSMDMVLPRIIQQLYHYESPPFQSVVRTAADPTNALADDLQAAKPSSLPFEFYWNHDPDRHGRAVAVSQ